MINCLPIKMIDSEIAMPPDVNKTYAEIFYIGSKNIYFKEEYKCPEVGIMHAEAKFYGFDGIWYATDLENEESLLQESRVTIYRLAFNCCDYVNYKSVHTKELEKLGLSLKKDIKKLVDKNEYRFFISDIQKWLPLDLRDLSGHCAPSENYRDKYERCKPSID